MLDLPRFRGGLRAWDQGIWSDGILLSCLVPFFCSAPGGAILPSRPARSGGQGRPHLERSAPPADACTSARPWLASGGAGAIQASGEYPNEHSLRSVRLPWPPQSCKVLAHIVAYP